MTVADEIRMQRGHLLELLKMIVLKGDCWHKQIEDILCIPCEPPLLNYDKCTNGCPLFLDEISKFIVLVMVGGLSRFLADTFINNALGPLSPDM